MTDEELRNLVASTAQATAANTVGLAESRRLLDEGLAETRRIIDANATSTAEGLAETRRIIDANATSTAEGLAETRRIIDANATSTAEGLAESRRLLNKELAETRQLINSNARATEANSDAISKLGEKVDQIDDAVVGLFERLDERLDRSDQRLDRLTAEFEHRLNQLIDLHVANAKEHADFVARGHQHDQQIQTLIEEGRADRAAAAARAEESDRKHLAATELIQRMFAEIQHINQRLAS